MFTESFQTRLEEKELTPAECAILAKPLLLVLDDVGLDLLHTSHKRHFFEDRFEIFNGSSSLQLNRHNYFPWFNHNYPFFDLVSNVNDHSINLVSWSSSVAGQDWQSFILPRRLVPWLG
jgi:hypothetical protein